MKPKTAEQIDFLTDTLHLLHGRKGDMGRWLYSDSNGPDDKVNGAKLWSEFVANSMTFYMHNADVQALHAALDFLPGKIKPGFSLIDLGPGSPDAFERKSFEIVAQLQPANHHIIDGAKAFRDAGFARLTKGMADGELKGLENIYLNDANFFKPMGLIETDASKPCLVYVGGGTIANLPIIRDDGLFPRKEYVNYFKQLHGVGQGKVSLLIPFDTNQDAASLINSYAEPRYANWVENLPHRMVRDLEIGPVGQVRRPIRKGFAPDGFKYLQQWTPQAHLMAHTLKAQADMKFNIGGASSMVEAGDSWQLNPSYKIPPALMKDIAKEAGWQVGAEFPVAKGKYTAIYFEQLGR